MTAERWTHVRALVERAMVLPAQDRAAFLRASGDPPELIAEAERLLSFDRQASALFSIDGWQQRGSIAAAPSLAGTLIGSYRLLEELGRGGMGAVYLAERADGVYQQKVAIKVLQESIFTPSLAERFRQERQILARLSDPGIARLLDGGVMPDGRPYLVLEYVDGQPIDQYCDEHELDVNARVRLILRVADVVQSAHQQLVLHLDLKPANILVTREGEPRLLDFGIARILSEAEAGPHQNEATLRLLTPRYASPEQAEGAPLGVASDVFSLATLLYRLLAGKLPYPIEDAAPLEAVRMLREVAPVAPSQAASPAVRGQLRGDLDTILLQALRKEPARRYPTVAAMADDLERHLNSQPVLAHADSFGYRASKFVRRNRVTVLAAAVVLVVLTASVAAVAHSAVVARRERSMAERRLKDVRALAHSYVFDLDPQLEEIPGTLKVRNFVLQNAQKYLEAMTSEAQEDDDLAREVAQGYSQISNVQATLAMPSLGDVDASAVSISRGITIQKHLVEKHPDDVQERLRLLRQMQHLATSYAYKGDIHRASEMIHQAWETGAPVRLLNPTPPRFTDVSSLAWDMAWMSCGNGDMWNLADPVAALPWLDQAKALAERHLASHPDEEKFKANAYAVLERVAITRAVALVQLGRAAEVRPLYDEALRLTTLTAHSMNEEEMRRQIRGYYAGYLLSVQDVRGALALAPLLLPPSFHEKGGDRLLTSDEADELTLLARIDFAAGDVASGMKRMEQGLATLEALYKSAPADAGVNSELAWDSFRLAEEAALPKATRRRLYLRAEEVAQAYASTYPGVMSVDMLLGKCELGLAEMAAVDHDVAQQKARGAGAAARFGAVLKAHAVQPEARVLLGRAEGLVGVGAG